MVNDWITYFLASLLMSVVFLGLWGGCEETKEEKEARAVVLGLLLGKWIYRLERLRAMHGVFQEDFFYL